MPSWGFLMNNNDWLKSEITRLELALQRQKERAEKAEATLAELEREVALLREKIKC